MSDYAGGVSFPSTTPLQAVHNSGFRRLPGGEYVQCSIIDMVSPIGLPFPELTQTGNYIIRPPPLLESPFL